MIIFVNAFVLGTPESKIIKGHVTNEIKFNIALYFPMGKLAINKDFQEYLFNLVFVIAICNTSLRLDVNGGYLSIN